MTNKNQYSYIKEITIRYRKKRIHNHPSGGPTPSAQDEAFTKKLKDITHAGGMQFFDHIIIGDNKYFGFAEKGLMQPV